MLFTVRLAKYCSRLPREVLWFVPLEILKIQLDIAQSNLLQLTVLEQVGLADLKSPYNLCNLFFSVLHG